jgi:hypothetical protein
MIIRVHGFGKDDPTESRVDPTSHLSLYQNATALTGYGRIVVLGDHQHKPTAMVSLPDVTAPIVILSMDA